MKPIQPPPHLPSSSPSSSPPPLSSTSPPPLSSTTLPRRRPNLTLHLPHRDPSLAVPLPLPPPSTPSSSSATATSASTNSNSLGFSELERVNRIGSGAGGTVYKVLHRRSGRIYALKVIYGNHEETVRRQICREIEILRDVDNPNVVRCFDMFEHNCEIQVLLEYDA
ncbi:hypothetical protein RND81_06G170900 [Saponaria officinalis]|uniref:Protein kinase domain-containing protein n=1 Tax=Saponaria officinalis TaxID=3572 RepID=A0AAW1I6N7_SAPOF